jgi:hypothetical protein
VEALLAELVRSARLPRRIAERARLVLHSQRVLSGVRRRRGSPMQFVKQGYFPDALLVFELYARGTQHGVEQLERWKARAQQVAAEGGGPAPIPRAEPGTEPAAEGEEGRRRRRRRGGRRRRGRGGENGDTDAAARGVAPEGAAEDVPAAEAAPAPAGPESLPPEPERRPVAGPADLLPF